jgi:hypothetical protein
VAIRSVAFPLLSGGALLLGYAAFAWLRAKPRALLAAQEPSFEHVQPLAEHLEHVPESLALDASSDEGLLEEEPLSARSSHIRALFLARLTEALSPFHNQLAQAQVSR